MTFGTFQGQLRPLVEAAWKNHCGLLGVSPSDKSERDAWYRDNLWAACRIASSKSATDSQRKTLVSWFSRIAGAPAKKAAPEYPPIAGWSTSQCRAFWKLAHAARQEAIQRSGPQGDVSLPEWVCQRLGSPASQSGGLFFGTSTDGFDAAMAILAVEASDTYWIDRTSAAPEHRLIHQITDALAAISTVTGSQVGWPYARAIYLRSNASASLPDSLADCPAEHLRKVLAMLLIHFRRVRSKSSHIGAKLSAFLPFFPISLFAWVLFQNP